MSNETFPFADGEEALPYVEDATGNRRVVLLAGVIAAALLVGAGAWFLLGGSSSTNTAAFSPSARAPHVTTATKKTVVKPAAKLPAAYKAQLGRDPFRALYVVPVVAAPGTTTPGTTTTTPTTTGTGTGTTPTTPGTTTASTRYALKLVSISKPQPEVRFFTWLVAGQAKTVIPAQRFGKVGEIVVLAYEKNAAGTAVGAIIQVGDDSPIDVKIGETVSVL
jgi:hypothetical protein